MLQSNQGDADLDWLSFPGRDDFSVIEGRKITIVTKKSMLESNQIIRLPFMCKQWRVVGFLCEKCQLIKETFIRSDSSSDLLIVGSQYAETYCQQQTFFIDQEKYAKYYAMMYQSIAEEPDRPLILPLFEKLKKQRNSVNARIVSLIPKVQQMNKASICNQTCFMLSV